MSIATKIGDSNVGVKIGCPNIPLLIVLPVGLYDIFYRALGYGA